jgi:hypothetical protein
MQDEVTKHTRKIYRAMNDRRRSFAEKTKEIIVEILIIVFAVTLSIWFHSWSEHRHEQKEVREFLIGIKDDLNKDIKLLEENRNTTMMVDSNFEFLYDIFHSTTTDTINEKAISSRLIFELEDI